MKVLLCTDNPDHFSADRDTTRCIVERGEQRGHTFYWADKHDLSWEAGELCVSARALKECVPGPAQPWIRYDEAASVAVTDFDLILVRNDPPVDLAYMRLCQLLSLVEDKVLICNPPRALLTHNEKLSALRFSSLMPATYVAWSDNMYINNKVASAKGVYKSLDSLGGEGVLAWPNPALPEPDLAEQHRALRAQLARGPDNCADADYLMAQNWINGVEKGDARVIMIGGEIAGAVLRVPRKGEFRGNIHMGGQVQAVTLDSGARSICAEVGVWLKREAIGLCGLDLVAGYLTEINITSPTGFREIEKLSNDRPSERFWQHYESRFQATERHKKPK